MILDFISGGFLRSLEIDGLRLQNFDQDQTSTTDEFLCKVFKFSTKLAVDRPEVGIFSPFKKYGLTFVLTLNVVSTDYFEVFDPTESLL